MDPKIIAVLTVFIIGLVSFLIGYFLTASGNNGEVKKLKEEIKKLKNEQKSVSESLEMRKKKIDKLRGELDNCTKEKNELKQKQAKLSDENRRLENISKSPTGKLYKQEYESMYAQYIQEMEKRKELESEKFKLMKESGNDKISNAENLKSNTPFINSTQNKSQDLTNKLNTIFSKVGFGNALQRDDLTKISGIGPDIQEKLNKIGIYNFKQISNLSPVDLEVIDEATQHFPGRSLRDDWIGQAKKLMQA